MIFIDSTYFIGLLLPKDNWNNQAKNVIIPKDTFLINNLVVSEVLNIVSKRSSRKVSEVYEILKNTCEIVCLTKEDYRKAMDLCEYYNNSVNYSDCLILVSMQNEGVDKIVSFDDGFKKVGTLKVIN